MQDWRYSIDSTTRVGTRNGGLDRTDARQFLASSVDLDPLERHEQHQRLAALVALWPPYGTVLKTRDLVLRPLTETDLPAYVATYHDDVELDPALPHHAALDARADRVMRIQQYLLRSRATWRPDS